MQSKTATFANYNKLTPTMCLRLAAPHTWAGPSVLTTVFGGVYSIWCGYVVTPLIWTFLLCVAIFAQSAVNTFNDWADFKAGTDTVENSDDPTDAVLVYDNPNPKHVLILGICYLVLAAIFGVICMIMCGSLVPLVFGLIGGIAVFAYSNGKAPISYLPLGEVFSGVVMGILIPLGDITVFAALSNPGSGLFASFLQVDWLHAIICTLPFLIGIGMIMATQNNCDIARDTTAGRHTLPALLGHERSILLYRIALVVWMVLVVVLAFVWFTPGAWVVPVVLLLQSGHIRKSMITPLVPEVRGPSMGSIMKCNVAINGALIIAIVLAMIMV